MKYLKKLLGDVRAILFFSLLALNLLFWIIFILFFFIIWLLCPLPSWRKKLSYKIHYIPELWQRPNLWLLNHFISTQWEIHQHLLSAGNLDNLNKNYSYLLISNHTSWTDILVIFKVFALKIPTMRFFMKEELKWQLPIGAQIAQALGFPFLKRFSKEYLAKNPEMKGKDIAKTRKTLERFKNIPITIVNYAEGHRWTEERHKKQDGPYKHLLKPRAGGTAFILAAMPEQLKSILSVTIIYSDKNQTMFDFMANRICKIQVWIEEIPVTPELIGNYEGDLEFRQKFQAWINKLWEEKDRLLEAQLSKNL